MPRGPEKDWAGSTVASAGNKRKNRTNDFMVCNTALKIQSSEGDKKSCADLITRGTAAVSLPAPLAQGKIKRKARTGFRAGTAACPRHEKNA